MSPGDDDRATGVTLLDASVITDSARSVANRLGRFAPTWWSHLAFCLALAIVHAACVLGDVPMIILSFAAPVAIGIGVRRHRPAPHWPWTLLIVAAVIFSIAGSIRATVGSTGDLSAARDLTPDVFAVTGYAIFAVALMWMLRAQGAAVRSMSLSLDGGIMALSAMLVGWVVLVAPVLFQLDAAPIAKLSIVVYPPISALLVTLAAYLAFGTAARSTAQNLVLAGMIALLIGDIAYVPLETGVFEQAPGRMLELPYALAYALISSAALHPSMADTVRWRTQIARASRHRFALIAVAFLTPAVMLFVWTPASIVGRVVVGSLAIALAVAAITRVITAARAQAAIEARLAHRATTDELTGLLNRTGALELVDRYLDESRVTGESVALLFVDLDRFKLVNDTYGHATGDQLLLAVSTRLVEGIGTPHTVSRLSGDEFLVVCPSTDRIEAERLAAVVADLFDEPFELIGTSWVTASVGVLVTGCDERDTTDTDAASLVRDVDTAMYEAKAAGRNGFVVFDPSMRAKAAQQLTIYNGLHRAIENDEFEVHYQVLIDAGVGTVHGVEALVRWRAPDGLVPPDQFISVAEDSGLISQIGEIVLRDSCSQVARWRRLPGCEELSVSVNVSGRQILDVDLVAVVTEVLDETGLDADALWLEITESVMMSDTVDTLATMSGLRALGVHLSVDDFGTGYSSLSYLHRYPVEQVKIDRQFVSGLTEETGSTGDGAVVAAVLGIAEALELDVVAEGVETEWQADHLDELGCGLLQGYFFSKPVPALDVGPILMERNEPEKRHVGDRRGR